MKQKPAIVKPNPYPPDDDRIRIGGYVGVADYNWLRQAIPFNGMQDQIVSNLFHKFISQLKNEGLPRYYDPENHKRVQDALERITFRRVGEDRSREADG